MADERSRRRGRLAQLFVLVVLLLAVLVAFQVTGLSQFDLERVTAWTVVAGTLLVVSSIALPVYLISAWTAAQEEARRKRRRQP